MAPALAPRSITSVTSSRDGPGALKRACAQSARPPAAPAPASASRTISPMM
jgi:hypothetical protein